MGRHTEATCLQHLHVCTLGMLLEIKVQAATSCLYPWVQSCGPVKALSVLSDFVPLVGHCATDIPKLGCFLVVL